MGDRKWMDELVQTITAHKICLQIKGTSCTNSEVEISFNNSGRSFFFFFNKSCGFSVQKIWLCVNRKPRPHCKGCVHKWNTRACVDNARFMLYMFLECAIKYVDLSAFLNMFTCILKEPTELFEIRMAPFPPPSVTPVLDDWEWSQKEVEVSNLLHLWPVKRFNDDRQQQLVKTFCCDEKVWVSVCVRVCVFWCVLLIGN